MCNIACFEFRGSGFVTRQRVCLCVLMFQLNSPMNSVSSTEDIKPPLGLNGVMKVPAQPSGTALSLTKHICAICGDRSSGECTDTGTAIDTAQVCLSQLECYWQVQLVISFKKWILGSIPRELNTTGFDSLGSFATLLPVLLLINKGHYSPKKYTFLNIFCMFITHRMLYFKHSQRNLQNGHFS